MGLNAKASEDIGSFVSIPSPAQNEVMDTHGGQHLSEITIAAFEDMGYEVDYSQADAYRIPRAAAKSVAHPTGWCEVLEPIGAIHPESHKSLEKA